jgi:hypothetical protein
MPKMRGHDLSPIPPPMVRKDAQTPEDGALYEVRSPFSIPSLSRMMKIHLQGAAAKVFGSVLI